MTPAHPSRLAWQVAVATFFSVGSLAAETVSGYVLEAQTQQRLAQVEVAFLVAGENGLAEMVRHSTDEKGVFSFSGPFLAAGTPFALVAHYGGLEYATETLVVGGQDQVIIEVFEGTQDDDQIQIDGHHLFLAVTPTGIDVAQLIHVDNLGASTYMGHAFGEERHVLQLQVPEGNLALQGHSGQVLRAGPTRLFTNSPLPPGRSQVTFTIQLDGEKFGGDYQHEVLYPTSRLELFLQPTDIELPSSVFQDLGEVHLQGKGYRHYRVRDLSPGRKVSIPLPYTRPLRWSLKWVMLVLASVMMPAAIALARSAGSPEGKRSVDAERRIVIAQLAGIDDRLETATGTETVDLRRQRRQLKEGVVLLYRQLADGGS